MGSKEKGNERSTEEGGRGKGWHSPWGFDDAVQVNVEEIAMPEAEKLAVLLRRDARLPRQFDRLARPRFRRQGRIRTSLGGKEGHPDGTVARVGVLGECGRARVCAWVVEVWRVEGSASDPSRREARMRVHRACSRKCGRTHHHLREAGSALAGLLLRWLPQRLLRRGRGARRGGEPGERGRR